MPESMSLLDVSPLSSEPHAPVPSTENAAAATTARPKNRSEAMPERYNDAADTTSRPAV